MRRSFLAATLVPVAAFAAITFGSTREAAAGATVDLDLNLGTAFQTMGQSRVDFSLGGGLGLGYRWNIPRSYVYLQPEVGMHYMRFGFNADVAGAGQYDYAFTLNGGLKLGLQGPVQPNVFAHLGLGYLGWGDYAYGSTWGHAGPEMDIGAGIDFKVSPMFAIGAQVAYNSVIILQSGYGYATQDAAKWLNFGIKASLLFGDAPPRRVYVRRVRYY